MRLWSIHPNILDQKGLVAAWREGLLAQSVIMRLQAGEQPGYRNHPQLARFLHSPAPLCLIGTWLTFIRENAAERGYNFNKDKIVQPDKLFRMLVTNGQLEYEFQHIQAKLKERDNKLYIFNLNYYNAGIKGKIKELIEPHPMFIVVDGEVEEWEKTK